MVNAHKSNEVSQFQALQKQMYTFLNEVMLYYFKCHLRRSFRLFENETTIWHQSSKAVFSVQNVSVYCIDTSSKHLGGLRGRLEIKKKIHATA